MKSFKHLKTWIEINQRAVNYNVKIFQSLKSKKTKLMAVVKSNAYGHGLWVFSQIADKAGVDGFCVDSVLEGITLRKRGIKKPILVLGFTMTELFRDAQDNDITVTISNMEGLKSLLQAKKRPIFHLKIDTGMHRHGFYINKVVAAMQFIKKNKLPIKGIFTHFSSAKDLNYPTYTEKQLSDFKKAISIFEKAGFKNLIKHASATGGTLINKKYHLDWIRVGIGLYGLWPSKELEMQLGDNIKFKPVLSWHTIVSEIKIIKKGDFIGYDLAYRAPKDTTIVVLPIGYWHGLPRGFSGNGEVLIKSQKSPFVGRVSMDIVVCDIGNMKCKVGDEVILVGKQNEEEILAFDAAQRVGTIHYELLTRLNPLIERVTV